jgi:hypothetical protein
MSTAVPVAPSRPAVTSDEALRIARLDAEAAVRDGLEHYLIQITRQPDGWHVDYELNLPGWNGGGPHYVIDPMSGQIIHKRYEQ